LQNLKDLPNLRLELSGVVLDVEEKEDTLENLDYAGFVLENWQTEV